MARRAMPNVVDSSAWLAYLANEPAADRFAGAIEDAGGLVVPSVCILEVFKVLLRERGEEDALQAAAVMNRGAVVDLDGTLALSAARVGWKHRLPLADSIVYATAEMVGGTLWTQDEHFKGLPNVEYVGERQRRGRQ